MLANSWPSEHLPDRQDCVWTTIVSSRGSHIIRGRPWPTAVNACGNLHITNLAFELDYVW